MLFKDLQGTCDYDATISQLWMKDYRLKFVNWREGTTFGIALIGSIDSYFRDQEKQCVINLVVLNVDTFTRVAAFLMMTQ